MIIAIIILLIIDVALFIYAIRTTPFGFEDENGWHEGKPNNECRTQSAEGGEERRMINAENRPKGLLHRNQKTEISQTKTEVLLQFTKKNSAE